MKNILKKFKINNYTYIFILLCFLCGLLKNIFIIMFICFIHELGHLFFIKLFGYDILKVELFPFGGFTTYNNKINSNINKDILISLGGIISQFIFLIILYLFKSYLNITTYHLFLTYSYTIIIFNILPIIPLDGSNFCHLIMEKFLSYHKSYYLNFYLSLFFILIFIFLNIYFHLDNYFIITFLIYKIGEYLKNYKYLNKRFLLERYLYDLEYQKIDNHTKSMQDLKKNTYHYFKKNNHYISEKEKLRELFDKSRDF